jgi:glutaminyl-tRNA synthetase
VRWLGFDWGEHCYFASDYFQQLYDMAEKLIVAGKAYVDSQSLEAIRERGSFHRRAWPAPSATAAWTRT